MWNDDARLVQQCISGDPSGFDALYDRHAARVYHLLRRLTGDLHAAEDLTQDTFLAAYRALSGWRGRGAFGTWLCGIACRQYANWRRRTGREECEPLDEGDELVDSHSDPWLRWTEHDLARRLEQAMALLPDSCREAFVLVKVEGFSYREAAALLDVPLGTVQSRLWRAVGLLQRSLADLGQPEESDTSSPMLACAKGNRDGMR